MAKVHRFLFVPVSCADGIGEYMRSLIIADGIKQQWPESELHFILNRHAPYAKDCPYPTTLIDSTPTKDVKGVNAIMSQLQPDIVLFDASGRKAHLAHAKQLGATTVFFSQHAKKRSKGLKWGRLKLTDHHFVVQPEFVMPKISVWQQIKLKLLNKMSPECIGPVFTPPQLESTEQILNELDIKAKQYVLFSAGSGGHQVNGRLAAEQFYQQAKAFSQQTGIPCVVVMGSNYPKAIPKSDENLRVLAAVDNQRFINLLATAKATVISGGDALLQAIALNVPTLAIAVSKDQPARIKKCHQHTRILTAGPNFSADDVTRLCTETEKPQDVELVANDAGLARVLTCIDEIVKK